MCNPCLQMTYDTKLHTACYTGTNQERRVLINLKRDENIVILPADIGRTTVVMHKNEYIFKATNLLKDTNTYQQLDQDPTKMTTARINKILQTLKDTKNYTRSHINSLHPVMRPL